MSPAAQESPGLILFKKPSGEKHQWLRVLTPESGILSVLQRNPGRNPNGSLPPLDLFDSLDLQLSPPRTGDQSELFFLKAAEVRIRRAAIGGSYTCLGLAVDYANLLLKNATHLDSYTGVFLRAEQTFDAFAESMRPELVFLKALFIFAREEGFPVRESWWTQLPAPTRAEAAHVLNTPVEGIDLAPPAIRRLRLSLEGWLGRNTDILI